jgi:hypothetical protein
VREEPVILDAAAIPSLLEDLQFCNAELDVVEKGLNDFLDTKKMAFPRFFFLSNDELLEILSEAKDPLNIQPFVKKCFEACKQLKFEESGEISGIESVEGEKIPLIEPVNPAASGAVEVRSFLFGQLIANLSTKNASMYIFEVDSLTNQTNNQGKPRNLKTLSPCHLLSPHFLTL